MGGALDERGGALGQPGGCERRVERQAHHRLGRAEGIAANAKHDGVAAAQHTGGVRQHVRAPFEDEGDHTQLGADQLSAPTVVIDALDQLTAPRARSDPAPQPLEHAAAQLVAGHQARGRAAARGRSGHVLGIRGGDLAPDLLRFEALRKLFVETRDLLIVHAAHGAKRPLGTLHGGGGNGHLSGQDVQQLAAALHHPQLIAGHEGSGQLRGDAGHPIAAEEDLLAGDEALQFAGFGGHGRSTVASRAHRVKTRGARRGKRSRCPPRATRRRGSGRASRSPCARTPAGPSPTPGDWRSRLRVQRCRRRRPG